MKRKLNLCDKCHRLWLQSHSLKCLR